ncbi:MAG: hypothetical protein WA140_06730 [Geobacteraceae bacterium]
MLYIGSFRKFAAFTILVVSLSVVLSNFDMKELVETSQEVASHNTFFVADDNETDTGLNDFKPPKQSFTDYSSFFGSTHLLPTYLPHIAFLTFTKPYQALLAVYQDIIVPPA